MLFLVNDMQSPPHPLKMDQIVFLVQKYAQCSETYEKTIFLFFVWENCLSYVSGTRDFSTKNLAMLQFFSRIDQMRFRKFYDNEKKSLIK